MLRALAIAAALALTAGQALRSSQTITVRTDGGTCQADVLVWTLGCSVQRDTSDPVPVSTRCDDEFLACGQRFRCDCRAVQADAGLLLPDGGLCTEVETLFFADGGMRYHCGRTLDGVPVIPPDLRNDWPEMKPRR